MTSALLLMLGASIYVLFREPVIFTEPLTRYGLNLPIIQLESGFWSHHLRFTIPDVLWDVALLTYSSTIKLTVLRVFALLLAPLYEIGQFLGLIWGTFNYTDFIVYIIITVIFIIRWKKDSQRLANA